MTGSQATFGEAQKKAADMAISEVNLHGGINGRKIELIIADTASDPKRAVDGYYALKMQGVNIFDVEGSPMVAATRKLIVDGGDFMITSGATTPTYYDNNIRSCRLTATAKNIGPIVADFLISKGYKKVSLFTPNNEYGKGFADEISKALNIRGGTVVVAEVYDPASSGDFRTNITKIKARIIETDVLFAINAANTVETMFRQINDIGWTKPVVSDYNTISNPAMKTLSLANGVNYVDWNYTPQASVDDSTSTRSYKNTFVAKYGKDPSLLDAAYYDGIKTILNSIQAVGDDTVKMGEYISSLTNYQVNTGLIASFDKDCEATRTLIFRKIQDGKVVNTIN